MKDAIQRNWLSLKVAHEIGCDAGKDVKMWDLMSSIALIGKTSENGEMSRDSSTR